MPSIVGSGDDGEVGTDGLSIGNQPQARNGKDAECHWNGDDPAKPGTNGINGSQGNVGGIGEDGENGVNLIIRVSDFVVGIDIDTHGGNGGRGGRGGKGQTGQQGGNGGSGKGCEDNAK